MTMTKEQAVAFHNSKAWEDLDHRARAEFQLQEPLLCMPFGVFHEAVEKAMGRPVYTHEFADPKSLLAELRGEKPARTMADILDLLPKDKTIIIAAPKEK